ncbi:MAG: putative dithiol-disulfide isomerase involved in polyketide biosynthesis [Clostridia bacterium]|jgi:predicted DsbA family dithiol-disulfide isomerase|nr:putative dithiol-disulfide isomerase involved in polyketide biosynthesis [Clostridia bacterium]
MPFEIHPETPKEGKLISEVFPAANVEKMFANLRNTGKLYDIDFIGNNLLSNSYLALTAGEFAKEKGEFEEFHEKIFHAYFNEGKDIGDIKVISNIAEGLGLNQEEMIEKLEAGTYDSVLNDTQGTAHQHNIRSTPTFIIDDKYSIVGAQSVETFKEVLLNIEKQ